MASARSHQCRSPWPLSPRPDEGPNTAFRALGIAPPRPEAESALKANGVSAAHCGKGQWTSVQRCGDRRSTLTSGEALPKAQCQV